MELLQFLVFLGVQLCARTSLLPAMHEAVIEYPHCSVEVYCMGVVCVWEGGRGIAVDMCVCPCGFVVCVCPIVSEYIATCEYRDDSGVVGGT